MRGLLFGLVCAGLALPLHDLWMHPDRVSVLTSLQVDAQTYHELAASLAAHGRWTDIPLRQPPGFVALLAVVYRVFGASYTAAKLLLWLCLVATTVLAAWLARHVWGRDAAWAAALLVATAPALRYYTGTVQYEVLAGAQLLTVIALAVRAEAARGFAAALAWTAAAGAAAGILVLTREVFVGILPLAALWLGGRVRGRWGGGRAVAAAAAFLTLAAVPAAAWSGVQSRRFGHLVVMSDKGPVTFALGNNPRASGTFNVVHVSEPSGLRFIRERPLAALQLSGRKALYFWGGLRDPWNVPRPAGLWIARATGGLVPLEFSLPLARGGWLLLLTLWACVVLLRSGRWHAWWIVPAVIGAVWAAHIATLSSHRFAVPVLPLVFVCGAGPIAAWTSAGGRWLGARPWRQAMAVSVILFAVAAQWLGAPPPEIGFRAAELVVIDARDGIDPASGHPVRLAPASLQVAPVMILADEYLAAGRYQVLLTVRRTGALAAPDTPVARVTLMDVEGGIVAREDVPFGAVSGTAFDPVVVPCLLPADGPVTLVVETLGRTDLAFDDVVFVRDRQPR